MPRYRKDDVETWGAFNHRRVPAVNVKVYSKSVTVVSRMYGLLVQAIEADRADKLELQRRLAKLEARLGIKWVPDAYYDGDYKLA